MPKGYNEDGSKKVRPAGSGRKPKESKAISPQISLEAFAVLAGLKKQKANLIYFISNAILEKATNDASKKADLPRTDYFSTIKLISYESLLRV
ncbi:hypothetical protein [Spirosoma litoris]